MIGVCKALEIEVFVRVVDPVAAACAGLDLGDDLVDKDLGRIAKYCAGRAAKPPELGVVRRFLQTAANSTERRQSSPTLLAFSDMLRRWPHADWLTSRGGAIAGLERMTTWFRNPAAHTDELGDKDYQECLQAVVGDAGLLLSLLRATTPR